MLHVAPEGRRIRMRGIVNGEGVRSWISRAAIWSGVSGRVVRDPGGITIDAFADPASLERFERILHTTLPPAARIAAYDSRRIESEPVKHFTIVSSEHADEAADQESMPFASGCRCGIFEDPCGCRA